MSGLVVTSSSSPRLVSRRLLQVEPAEPDPGRELVPPGVLSASAAAGLVAARAGGAHRVVGAQPPVPAGGPGEVGEVSSGGCPASGPRMSAAVTHPPVAAVAAAASAAASRGCRVRLLACRRSSAPTRASVAAQAAPPGYRPGTPTACMIPPPATASGNGGQRQPLGGRVQVPAGDPLPTPSPSRRAAVAASSCRVPGESAGPLGLPRGHGHRRLPVSEVRARRREASGAGARRAVRRRLRR